MSAERFIGQLAARGVTTAAAVAGEIERLEQELAALRVVRRTLDNSEQRTLANSERRAAKRPRRKFVRRPWTDQERRLLREQYGRRPATAIAQQLGRPVHQVYQAADRWGLAQRRKAAYAGVDEFIRAMHAEGWSDSEIAAGWSEQPENHPIGRESIRDRRRRLGLPSNALHERRRQRVRDKTAEQLQRKGLESLAMERVEAYRRFAVGHGWPAELRPRAVQIMDLLYEQGPHTRREIAEAIGMTWRGSRASLTANGPGGSYLAELMRLGLVVQLGRIARGRGRGKSVHKYAIPAHVVRGPIQSSMEAQDHGEQEKQDAHAQGDRRRVAAGGADVSGATACGRG